jgi:hypothetical protein
VAVDSSAPVKVFLSYSRDDARFRDAFRAAMAHLENAGLLEIWHDPMIQPGHDWSEKIAEELEAAHIIVLLVSPAFNASGYIRGVELARALARHGTHDALLVPIFVRPVGAMDLLPFAAIQALPIDGRLKPVSEWQNEDRAWAHVAEKLRAVADEVRSGSRQGAPAASLASALLAEALAMLHVDLMRLAVVIFDPAANRANHNRIAEFFKVADDQVAALDLQLASATKDLPKEVLREGQAIRTNCVKTRQALKYAERNVGPRPILANLRGVAERIKRLLESTAPSVHRDNINEARAALSRAPLAEGPEIGRIADRRCRAQSNLLESSSLRSIAEDFDQTLAVPYFLIDYLLLVETAA